MNGVKGREGGVIHSCHCDANRNQALGITAYQMMYCTACTLSETAGVGTPRKAWAWLPVSAWLWPASMGTNQDELRKRQSEYAGIAMLPSTHSNNIVVRMKQSLAAGKQCALLATECKAQEICSPQHFPAQQSIFFLRWKGRRSSNTITARRWEPAAFFPWGTPNTRLLCSTMIRL